MHYDFHFFLLKLTACFCLLVFLRFQGGKCERKKELSQFSKNFAFQRWYLLVNLEQYRAERNEQLSKCLLCHQSV